MRSDTGKLRKNLAAAVVLVATLIMGSPTVTLPVALRG